MLTPSGDKGGLRENICLSLSLFDRLYGCWFIQGAGSEVERVSLSVTVSFSVGSFGEQGGLRDRVSLCLSR